MGPPTTNRPVGFDVELGVPPGDTRLLHHRRDHVLEHVGADDAHVLDLGGVLGGDDDAGHLDGAVVLVADGDLRLAVGAQVRQRPIVAHGGQALGQRLARWCGMGMSASVSSVA